MLPSTITAPIQDELELLEEKLGQLVRSDLRLVDQAMRHVLTNRGKRVRPVMVLLCSHLAGGQPRGHISSAAAIELLHTATLVHDDVVDESPLRRGAATLNAIWGNRTSILLGDYMFAKALQAALEAGDPRVLHVISEVSQRMSEGELRQLSDGGVDRLDPDEYFRVICDKTASLFSASCQLGGLAAGLAPDELRRLGALGEKVGMAFQITDDVLDYVGQPDKTGKPPAQDLKERKVTLPLLKALERSTPEERQLVDSFLRSTSGDSGADRILEIVRRRGGAEAALDEARRFQRQARSLLNSFQPGPHRSALAALIDFVVDREN